MRMPAYAAAAMHSGWCGPGIRVRIVSNYAKRWPHTRQGAAHWLELGVGAISTAGGWGSRASMAAWGLSCGGVRCGLMHAWMGGVHASGGTSEQDTPALQHLEAAARYSCCFCACPPAASGFVVLAF